MKLGKKMSFSKCTLSFLKNVGVVPDGVPLKVLEDCIFSQELFNDLISLNSTACVSSVVNYENDVSYACTRHFLSSHYNHSEENCYQFYHTQGHLYDTHRCYTVGEQLHLLFEVSESAGDIIVFVLSILFYLVLLFKHNPYSQ